MSASGAADGRAQQSPASQPAPDQAVQAGADQKDQKAEAKEPPTPPHTGIRALASNLVEDVKHLPSKQNLYLTLIGAGIAGAVHPADQNINARLISHYDAVNTAFAPGKYLGNTPEQVAASLGTYAFGRIFDQPKVSHLGMDLLQAQILTEGLVQPLKFGTVTFTPPSGATVTAEIQPDGSYKAPGVPTGSSRITVSAVDPAVTQYFKDLSASSKAVQKGEGGAPKPKGDPKSFYIVPEKYSDAGLSGLSYDVKTGPNTYDIDLQ